MQSYINGLIDDITSRGDNNARWLDNTKMLIKVVIVIGLTLIIITTIPAADKLYSLPVRWIINAVFVGNRHWLLSYTPRQFYIIAIEKVMAAIIYLTIGNYMWILMRRTNVYSDVMEMKEKIFKTNKEEINTGGNGDAPVVEAPTGGLELDIED